MSPPKANPAKLASARMRNREVNRFEACGSIAGLLETKIKLAETDWDGYVMNS